MYSFYFGFLPSLGIDTFAAYLFTGALFLIATGIITAVAEIASLQKDILFTAGVSSVIMLLYLGCFGVFGVIVLPCIWLTTHILIIQRKKG